MRLSLLSGFRQARRIKAAGDAAIALRKKRIDYRVAYKKKKTEDHIEWHQKAADKAAIRREIRIAQSLKRMRLEARKSYREDWALGPLAPKRDYGEKEGTFGALSPGQIAEQDLPEREIRREWNKIGDNYFKPSDRVVITLGREKGKIGEISSINENRVSAKIEGLNKVNKHLNWSCLALKVYSNHVY